MLKAGFCISWASAHVGVCHTADIPAYDCLVAARVGRPGTTIHLARQMHDHQAQVSSTPTIHFSAIFSTRSQSPIFCARLYSILFPFSSTHLISTVFLFVTFFDISPPLLATSHLLCLQQYRRPTSFFRYHCSGCLPHPLERERQNLKMTYHRQTWPVTISIDGSDVPEGKHKPTQDD